MVEFQFVIGCLQTVLGFQSSGGSVLFHLHVHRDRVTIASKIHKRHGFPISIVKYDALLFQLSLSCDVGKALCIQFSLTLDGLFVAYSGGVKTMKIDVVARHGHLNGR